MRQTIQARVINALRLWVDFCVDFKGKQRGCYYSGHGDFKALSLSVDNPSLQDAVLHFITSILTVDHPKFCKPLRMNILIIKVGITCVSAKLT